MHAALIRQAGTSPKFTHHNRCIKRSMAQSLSPGWHDCPYLSHTQGTRQAGKSMPQQLATSLHLHHQQRQVVCPRLATTNSVVRAQAPQQAASTILGSTPAAIAVYCRCEFFQLQAWECQLVGTPVEHAGPGIHSIRAPTADCHKENGTPQLQSKPCPGNCTAWQWRVVASHTKNTAMPY